jgi:spore cortex formation protein SpoVR/YcgB (stage V sporulation)
MKLFALTDDGESPYYTVSGIHDERGYRYVRDALAKSYDLATHEPDIQVVDVDLRGDRKLELRHTMREGVPLAQPARDQVLQHVRLLWGYDVSLVSVEA